MSKGPAAPKLPDLSYIAEDLRPLAVVIDSLTPDPHNARLHGEKNRAAVADSLRLNRQLKPITVDADGVILTGNCTWETAKDLGWKFIARTRTNLRGGGPCRTTALPNWLSGTRTNSAARLRRSPPS